MKAVRYYQYGDSDVLVYEDVPRPTPRPGQVLVRVVGTSFNPVDSAIRAGFLQPVFPLTLPHVPNVDLAGTIVELGEGVSGWNTGDAVVAFLPMTEDGAAAEFVLVSADLLVHAPNTVDLVEAAALPLVALTAWQALFDEGKLQAGQTVLINGAGGSVGGYAVQLAKGIEAVVTATASPRSRERIAGYGADRIVDYTDGPLTTQLAGERFDLVLNLVRVSEGEIADLVDLVADGGVLISATTPPPVDAERGVRTGRVFSRSDAARLAELVTRVDDGQLHIDVAERSPLKALRDVHARADAGQLTGKVVVLAAVDDPD